MSGIAGDLIAAGTGNGDEERRAAVAAAVREWADAGDRPLLARFEEELETHVRAVAERNDNGELHGITADWESVAAAIRDLDPEADEKAAVDRVVDAVAGTAGFEVRPGTRQDLREAVVVAYGEAVGELVAALDDGVDAARNGTGDAPLREALADWTDGDPADELAALRGRLDDLADRTGPPDCYDLVPAGEADAVAAAIEPGDAVEFVDRPDLAGVDPGGRLLVVGPTGAGKTRALAHLCRAWAPSVSHVLRPDPTLLTPRDRYGFEREEFGGDALLVWDDLHRIDGDRDDDLFEDVLSSLSAALEERGHDLHVLATADPTDPTSLPGEGIRSVEAVDRREAGVWAGFETLSLAPLEDSRLRTMARRMADREGIELEGESDEAEGTGEEGDGDDGTGGAGDGEDVLDRIVAAAPDDAAPGYLDAVFRTTGDGGTLTGEDVRSLPTTAGGVWTERYDRLADESPREMDVLQACSLLHEVGVPAFAPVVWGVYRSVVGEGDRDREEFRDAVRSLVDRRWLAATGTEDADLAGPDVSYRPNETGIEAVGEMAGRSLAAHAGEFSSFLEGDLVPGSAFLAGELADGAGPLDREGVVALLHGRFADRARRLGHGQVAGRHYARALNADPESAALHYRYAGLLAENDRLERAERHYRRALILSADGGDPLDGDYPRAHNDYARLLVERDFPEGAEQHYHRALELTSPTGNLIDSHYAAAHNNYGLLLENQGWPERAAEHYRRVLELTGGHVDLLDGEEPEAHYNYANLLSNRGDPETAGNHYRRALELTAPGEDPDPIEGEYVPAHNNYANLLSTRGDTDRAAEHYRRALELTSPTGDPVDGDSADAHNNYATLLKAAGRTGEAERHYRRALELTGSGEDPLSSDLPQAHYNYATLLADQGDRESAEDHYRRALELTAEGGDPLDSDYAKAHYNYANLLAKAERFADARPHLERSLRLWRNSGEPGNALHVLRLLAAVEERLGEGESAIDRCETALSMLQSADEEDPTFDVLYALLSERSLADRLPELYGLALETTLRGDADRAAGLFYAAWRHRDAVASADLRILARSAGIWLGACATLVPDLGPGPDDDPAPVDLLIDYDWPGDVARQVEDETGGETDDLSLPVQALYTWVFTDDSAATPMELRQVAGLADRRTQLEVRAYERLLELVGE